MTLENYLHTVFQLGTAVAFTMMAFSAVAVVCYWCWRAAEALIKKRNKYISRIKKSHAFKVFNEPAATRPQLVKKTNGKVAAK